MRITAEHVDTAHLLAVKNHRGQKYGKEDYYGYHLCGVLDRYKSMYPNYAPYEEVAVILHDIVEDTEVEMDFIFKTFGDKVGSIVDSMTKKRGESYGMYIRRLSRNPSAVKVKRADASFNLQESIKEDLVDNISKYKEVLSTLESI